MSKPKSDQVFHLIGTMTPSEKRAFRLQYSGSGKGDDKKYLRLFDYLDKQEEPDDERLLRMNPTIQPSQLSNLKANLYLHLLRSLDHLAKSVHPELKLTEMIDHARILYHRCLYKECLSMIDKAKKKAMANDSFLLLLEILELEKLAVGRSSETHSDKRVNEIVKETERTALAIRNINSFSNLSLQLNNYYQKTGFIRNKRELEKVRKMFFHALPDYNENELSFHEKMYLYHSQTGFYFFIQDSENGLYYAKLTVKLFEDYPEMIPRKLEMYIRALNNLLVAQNKLYHYQEFMKTHRKLVAIKRNRTLFLSENINLNLFKAIYIHEINRHFMLGEFRSGTKIVGKLESELNAFIPKLDTHTVIIFYYKIACLYFGAGNFKVALRWLTKITQLGKTSLREDIHAFAGIVRLICYYELKDTDRMEHAILSTYRSLLRNRNFIRYHQLILEFLKGDRKPYSGKEIIEQFKKLKSGMEIIARDPFEKRAFLYFDMISWLESKITGKSIEEVIRKKAELRVRL